MKTALLISATLVASGTLSACASTTMSVEDAYAPGQTSFEGWVNFEGEEFQLISSENRYRARVRRPCVSGALPRDQQRLAATNIAGQKVRITGTTMAWSDNLPGHRYTYEGSNIRNECDGAFAILATDIAPIP